MKATTANKVVVKCNDCGAEYEMKRKDIAKTAAQNQGFVPCYFCGSHATTWNLGKETEI